MGKETPDNQSVFRKIYSFLKPPPKWQFPVIILLGIMGGLIIHTFYISNAVSYLSDDPKTCINCHVMNPQFKTWERSSHGRFATCNDCHVPQDNILRTYWFKAQDGMRHATIFTLRTEPQVIQIKDAGKQAVQENCIRCHQNNIHPIAVRAIGAASIIDEGQRFCWDCHREVPHGRVNSLSSTPYANVPRLTPIIPEWLSKFIEEENSKK